ncbi:MAG: PqqD family protein [Byssovorax sp.]
MSDINRLSDLALSDTGFVFDPYSGSTFTVNPTGLAVLKGLKEGLSKRAIGERIAAAFAVPAVDLGRDIDEFVITLSQHGIVPEGFSV